MTGSKYPGVGFIGGGNMAEAMIKGLVAAGRARASLSVFEPLAARRRLLRSRYGVRVVRSNAELIEDCNIAVLAVKPQVLMSVAAEIAPVLDRRTLVVSIAAGVRLAKLEKTLGPDRRVVRVMPNTPCLVGKGMSVLCPGAAARSVDVRNVKRLFATVGDVAVVDEERLMDAVTGLSGSGPAYVYAFAEALIAGGRKAGLDQELATRLAYRTIAGAAEMLEVTGRPPAELRLAVSSPGGTTVAGLARLAEGKFLGTVREAVVAAARRSKQLARTKS
jgi:pyrroline-5-carboxylate reductase